MVGKRKKRRKGGRKEGKKEGKEKKSYGWAYAFNLSTTQRQGRL